MTIDPTPHSGAFQDPGPTTSAERSSAVTHESPFVADEGEIRFARILGALGLAILGLGAVLLYLPISLEGSFQLYLIADGIAFLFAPVGFTLLAASIRTYNRARHGTEMPPAHRRRVIALGAILVVVGLFVAFSGFGTSGTLSRALNLIWGLSLALYGVRYLFRSVLAA